MTVIGLVGRKGSGKSTTASIMVDQFVVTEYSIASPLKQVCEILGAPKQSLYGTQAEKELVIPELGMSGRRLMQKLGTDLFRKHFGCALPEFNLDGFNTIWVFLLNRFLQNNKDVDIIVSDVRFQDEADVIKANGGVLVRVEREPRNCIVGVDPHASEQELCEIVCEYTLDNTGTLEQLDANINDLLDQIG